MEFLMYIYQLKHSMLALSQYFRVTWVFKKRVEFIVLIIGIIHEDAGDLRYV